MSLYTIIDPKGEADTTTSRLDQEEFYFKTLEIASQISENLRLNEIRALARDIPEIKERIDNLEIKISLLDDSKHKAIQLFEKLTDMAYEKRKQLDPSTRFVLVEETGDEFSLFIVDSKDQNMVFEIVGDFLIKFNINIQVLTEAEYKLVIDRQDLKFCDITDITVGELETGGLTQWE